jgi:hypothetical protein
VRDLLARAVGEAPDPAALRTLWAVLVYVAWAERFLDQPPVAPRVKARLTGAEAVGSAA